MKDYLRELVEASSTAAEAGLAVREYLQARVLDALQRGGAFSTRAFLGGTALRFLFRLPRFSEDLDFSSTAVEPSRSLLIGEFSRLMDHVRSTFAAEAYEVEIRSRPEAVVQSAFVAFPGLPHELGLSPQRTQKIAIKVEVDTNPPPHAQTQTTIVRRHVLLNLLHYDKASLFAGKLHALLHRPYVKGRDIYDLVWYLSDPTWPKPNLALLGASLAQTGMELSDAEVAGWRRLLAGRVAKMDFDRVVADVAPFLERAEEVAMLTRENVLRLLNRGA